MNPRYITSISELDNLVGLAPKAREMMETVTELIPFRSNEYFLSLIDWKDDHDPLRRILIPGSHELKTWGPTDPSSEKDYPKIPGLQHEYGQTGLLLLTDICGGICRLTLWFDDYRHLLSDFDPKRPGDSRRDWTS